jgi:hypothetical protein
MVIMSTLDYSTVKSCEAGQFLFLEHYSSKQRSDIMIALQAEWKSQHDAGRTTGDGHGFQRAIYAVAKTINSPEEELGEVIAAKFTQAHK